MRIPAYSPGLYPADSVRRATAMLVNPPEPLSDRYPQQQPQSRPLAERVHEGEILPRPVAAQSLLTDYRASTLARAAVHSVSTAEAAPQVAAPSQLLFYLLHSSNEALTDNRVGHHVDQRV